MKKALKTNETPTENDEEPNKKKSKPHRNSTKVPKFDLDEDTKMTRESTKVMRQNSTKRKIKKNRGYKKM